MTETRQERSRNQLDPCHGERRSREALDLWRGAQRIRSDLDLWRGEDGQLWLRDLMSSNGTYVNGARITEAVKLSVGDVLHFAQVEFLVKQKPAEPTVGRSLVTVSRSSPRQAPRSFRSGWSPTPPRSGSPPATSCCWR